MTSVIGHLNGLDFEQRYKKWQSCRPGELFDAPVIESVDPVSSVSYILTRPQADMPRGQSVNRGEHQAAGQICKGTLHLDRLRPRR